MRGGAEISIHGCVCLAWVESVVFSVVQFFDTLGGFLDVVEQGAEGCVLLHLCVQDFREHLIDDDSDILKDGTSGFELAHVLDRVCFHVST